MAVWRWLATGYYYCATHAVIAGYKIWINHRCLGLWPALKQQV